MPLAVLRLPPRLPCLKRHQIPRHDRLCSLLPELLVLVLSTTCTSAVRPRPPPPRSRPSPPLSACHPPPQAPPRGSPCTFPSTLPRALRLGYFCHRSLQLRLSPSVDLRRHDVLPGLSFNHADVTDLVLYLDASGRRLVFLVWICGGGVASSSSSLLGRDGDELVVARGGFPADGRSKRTDSGVRAGWIMRYPTQLRCYRASSSFGEELKVFSTEVVCIGNRCKDPQWHNLDRYFDKLSSKRTPQHHLKEEAESVMQKLVACVQYTAELYHEMHALDRFEQMENSLVSGYGIPEHELPHPFTQTKPSIAQITPRVVPFVFVISFAGKEDWEDQD